MQLVQNSSNKQITTLRGKYLLDFKAYIRLSEVSDVASIYGTALGQKFSNAKAP
jgi:hypothetical protein